MMYEVKITFENKRMSNSGNSMNLNMRDFQRGALSDRNNNIFEFKPGGGHQVGFGDYDAKPSPTEFLNIVGNTLEEYKQKFMEYYNITTEELESGGNGISGICITVIRFYKELEVNKVKDIFLTIRE